MPKFSIILPVRNGGSYVKECIKSILSQTCQDFNLIVLDNCSTDGSYEWVHSLPDDRITIYPASEPLSIEQNWARITTVPKNEFMTCIGHDDLLLPGYLEEINALIVNYPRASLYQTQFNYIDASGNFIRRCKPVYGNLSTYEFLEKILTRSIDLNGTGFMTRSEDYDRVGGIPLFPNLLFADFKLWLEISRFSGLVISQVNCFSYRLHVSTTSVSPDEKFQAAFNFLMEYLYSLKTEDPRFRGIINMNAKTLISFFCKSLAHRLLRTERDDRRRLTVEQWAHKCDEYANLLIDNNSYKPSLIPSVRLARMIDKSVFGRKLFLFFKKVYPKPVLK